MRRRVVHLSSVHRAEDNRIHYKEAASLAAAGWDVVLVTAGPAPPRMAHGVRWRQVPAPKSRLERMLSTTRAVVRAALAEEPAVVHFHDPELLPFVVPLRQRGITTIYDVHEDVADTVAYKGYLPASVRPLVGRVVRTIERWALRRVSGLVAATPAIAERVRMGGRPVEVVQNFPRMEELGLVAGAAATSPSRRLAYVGRISLARGAITMLDMLTHLPPDVRLDLAGEVTPAALTDTMAAHPSWRRVEFHGFVDRPEVARITAGARVGLILLRPERNYLDSYPTKMFEYMAAGIPVVASDFPLWRSVVERARCGLLVDPRSPEEAATAVRWLLEHPDAAEEMGRAGRVAVEREYNWSREAEKLTGFYERLLASDTFQS